MHKLLKLKQLRKSIEIQIRIQQQRSEMGSKSKIRIIAIGVMVLFIVVSVLSETTHQVKSFNSVDPQIDTIDSTSIDDTQTISITRRLEQNTDASGNQDIVQKSKKPITSGNQQNEQNVDQQQQDSDQKSQVTDLNAQTKRTKSSKKQPNTTNNKKSTQSTSAQKNLKNNPQKLATTQKQIDSTSVTINNENNQQSDKDKGSKDNDVVHVSEDKDKVSKDQSDELQRMKKQLEEQLKKIQESIQLKNKPTQNLSKSQSTKVNTTSNKTYQSSQQSQADKKSADVDDSVKQKDLNPKDVKANAPTVASDDAEKGESSAVVNDTPSAPNATESTGLTKNPKTDQDSDTGQLKQHTPTSSSQSINKSSSAQGTNKNLSNQQSSTQTITPKPGNRASQTQQSSDLPTEGQSTIKNPEVTKVQDKSQIKKQSQDITGVKDLLNSQSKDHLQSNTKNVSSSTSDINQQPQSQSDSSNVTQTLQPKQPVDKSQVKSQQTLSKNITQQKLNYSDGQKSINQAKSNLNQTSSINKTSQNASQSQWKQVHSNFNDPNNKNNQSKSTDSDQSQVQSQSQQAQVQNSQKTNTNNDDLDLVPINQPESSNLSVNKNVSQSDLKQKDFKDNQDKIDKKQGDSQQDLKTPSSPSNLTLNITKESQSIPSNISSLFKRLENMEKQIQFMAVKPTTSEPQKHSETPLSKHDDTLQLSNLEQKLDSMETKITEIEEKIKVGKINNEEGNQQVGDQTKKVEDKNHNEDKERFQAMDGRISKLQESLYSINKQLDSIEKENLNKLNQLVPRKEFDSLKESVDKLTQIVSVLQKSLNGSNYHQQQTTLNTLLTKDSTSKLQTNNESSKKQLIDDQNQVDQNSKKSLSTKTTEKSILVKDDKTSKEKQSQLKIVEKDSKKSTNQNDKTAQTSQQTTKKKPNLTSEEKETKEKDEKNINEEQEEQSQTDIKQNQPKEIEEDLVKETVTDTPIMHEKTSKETVSSEKDEIEEGQQDYNQQIQQKKIKQPAKKSSSTSSNQFIFGFSMSQIILYLGVGIGGIFLCNRAFFKKPSPSLKSHTKQYNPSESSHHNYSDSIEETPHNRSIDKFKARKEMEIIDDLNEDEMVSDRRMGRQTSDEDDSKDHKYTERENKNVKSQLAKNQQVNNARKGTQNDFLSLNLSTQRNQINNSQRQQSNINLESLAQNISFKNNSVNSTLSKPITNQQSEGNRSIKPLKKPTSQSALEKFQKVIIPEGFSNDTVSSNVHIISQIQSISTNQAKSQQEDEFDEYEEATNPGLSLPEMDQLPTKNEPLLIQQNIKEEQTEHQHQEDEFEAFQESRQVNQTEIIQVKNDQDISYQPLTLPNEDKNDRFVESQFISLEQSTDQPEISQDPVDLTSPTQLDATNQNQTHITIQPASNTYNSKNDQPQLKDDDPFGDLM